MSPGTGFIRLPAVLAQSLWRGTRQGAVGRSGPPARRSAPCPSLSSSRDSVGHGQRDLVAADKLQVRRKVTAADRGILPPPRLPGSERDTAKSFMRSEVA